MPAQQRGVGGPDQSGGRGGVGMGKGCEADRSTQSQQQNPWTRHAVPKRFAFQLAAVEEVLDRRAAPSLHAERATQSQVTPPRNSQPLQIARSQPQLTKRGVSTLETLALLTPGTKSGSPQRKASPPAVTAPEWAYPADTERTSCVLSVRSTRGRHSVPPPENQPPPWPRQPCASAPQVNTSPEALRAMLWCWPQAMPWTRVPGVVGGHIGAGRRAILMGVLGRGVPRDT